MKKPLFDPRANCRFVQEFTELLKAQRAERDRYPVDSPEWNQWNQVCVSMSQVYILAEIHLMSAALPADMAVSYLGCVNGSIQAGTREPVFSSGCAVLAAECLVGRPWS